jgi:hypothetical protein
MNSEEAAHSSFRKRRNKMVAVTFGGARTAVPAVGAGQPAKKGKGILARLFHAVADAQMKRAERELSYHRHLLPRGFTFDPMNWSGKDDQEPFGGW